MAYIYDSHEYTGNPATFTDTHGTSRITNISVPFSPIQDLHGYANPWPAGGGVNKYDMANWPYSTSRRYWGTDVSSIVTALNSLAAGTYTITAKIKIDALTDTSGNRTYGFLCTGVSVDGRKTIATPAVGTVVSVSKTFTLSSAQVGTFTHCYWYVGTSSSNSDTATISEVGINVGSDDTYYPYSNICPISGRTGLNVYVSPTTSQADAITYSVDWTSEAGTVYGGTLDVVTGVLTVDRASVDLGTLRWNYSASEAEFYAAISDIKPSTRNLVCDRYIVGGKSIDKSILCVSRILRLYDSAYTSAETLKASLTNAYLVYELATPLTYQLTPQEVAVIKNSVNNVWADTGNSVTVTVFDMLYGFQGWLIKVGSGMALIPTEMIQAETYKASPNQRMEESAERDVSGYLWRNTVANQPPKIEFETPPCYNADVKNLNDILKAAYSVPSERKLPVAYYDNEEDCYKTADCYIPNIDFPIRTIDIENKVIFYDPIRYAFIGY